MPSGADCCCKYDSTNCRFRNLSRILYAQYTAKHHQWILNDKAHVYLIQMSFIFLQPKLHLEPQKKHLVTTSMLVVPTAWL